MKVEIGSATLYLGDCMDILPTLPKVDAVITDPPYGVELQGKSNKWKPEMSGGYISFEDSPSNVVANVIPRFVAALSISKRGVLTPGTRMAHSYPAPDAMGGIYNRCGAGSGKWGFECVAPVYYYGPCPYLATGQGRRPNGWEQPVNDYADKSDHPCPKPIGLMVWLVERGSLCGETILDPFMGSGTTGVAAIQLGRKFIGIEREPKYFDIACKRIEQAVAQGQLFEPEQPKQVQEQMFVSLK
jgi:site-specific DNA-methyltransferase (adenine-specific)/modification methylase